MATAGENALLAEVLQQVRHVGDDVSMVRVTVGEISTGLSALVDRSKDHEDRIRKLAVDAEAARRLAEDAKRVADHLASEVAANTLDRKDGRVSIRNYLVFPVATVVLSVGLSLLTSVLHVH